MPIDLAEVGAAPRTDAAGHRRVHIGIYLPHIGFPAGYRVQVRVIHERDQFTREIEPRAYDLFWREGSALDLWDLDVDLDADPGGAGAGHFGQDGTYLYRFQVLRGQTPLTPWFADPFGRASGLGSLSAFTLDAGARPFPWTDAGFRVPPVDELVVYELHVGEFNRTFSGVAAQLDHLVGLGVNALELMPVTNVKEDVEWGYTPLSYFTPDERYGTPDELRRLVDACHGHGVAVVLDAVYAHAHPEFAYSLVYERTGEPNPMMGRFAGEFFEGSGRFGTDYTKEFTRDYFRTVNRYWLQEYHVDGFRYDYVPGMFDGPTGQGYADLVFHTYRHTQDAAAYPRFAGPGHSRVVQCAEHLPDPRGILATTYSNTCWQNELFDLARAQARSAAALPEFARQLDPELVGYPSRFTNPATGETIPVAPFQYVESHDHSRFVNTFGEEPFSDVLGLRFGDRSRFFRTQPYVIAQYTAKGVPMLWQGQEFAENWGLPDGGAGRVLHGRPLHWEYFYDSAGRALVRLHRIMGSLRRRHRGLRSRGSFFYYDDPFHRRDGVIAYRRDAPAADGAPAETLVVLLNFSDATAQAWIPWPHAGRWEEQIDATAAPVETTQDGQWQPVPVPSHYGAVYLHRGR